MPEQAADTQPLGLAQKQGRLGHVFAEAATPYAAQVLAKTEILLNFEVRTANRTAVVYGEPLVIEWRERVGLEVVTQFEAVVIDLRVEAIVGVEAALPLELRVTGLEARIARVGPTSVPVPTPLVRWSHRPGTSGCRSA